MVIAVTGHRPQKLGFEWDGIGPISDALYNIFQTTLKEKGCTKAISGMALGVDMLFAEAALALGIPVIAAIPFIGQEKAWPQKSQDRYNKILSHPLVTKYVVCPGGYSGFKMQKRNEWMVDNSELLFSVYDGSAGGTRNCVKYAESKGKQRVTISPKDII